MLEGLAGFAVLFAIFMGGRHLLRRVERRARAHVPSMGGVLALRPSRAMGLLLAACALLPALLVGGIVAVWMSDSADPGGFLYGGVLTLVLLGFSAYQFAAAFRKRVLVDDAGLERVGVFARRRIPWGEVARVAYNPHRHWFFLTARDGSHLWLEESLNGIGDFAGIALARLAPATLVEDPFARDALAELAEAVRREERVAGR